MSSKMGAEETMPSKTSLDEGEDTLFEHAIEKVELELGRSKAMMKMVNKR